MPSPLPIHSVLPSLYQALSHNPTAILTAPTGSGKTTAVPLALLSQPWLQGQTILILEPRRLAARMAAQRMASLLNEAVGQTVGYRIRFDHKVSAKTRIEVVTEGILTRRLQQDPGLEGVGLVIFDEFHERSLQADLGLALCWDILTVLRDDLRLLLMSATLDTATLSTLLNQAPVIIGQGQSYPVEVHYLNQIAKTNLIETTFQGIQRALQEQNGDLLVFLPGTREIRQLDERLKTDPDLLSCPLYGDLPRQAQDRALRPGPAGQRRVVLATSIAETSLTIEGITTVVDAGWSRLPRFNPNTGLTALATVRVSQAAADQRTGRAGRLGPGHCYRLWHPAEQAGLQAHSPPEILNVDMTPLVLELAQWGVRDPQQLRWLDAPTEKTFSQAQTLLVHLGALDAQQRITPLGARMARLPLHPRLAHLLLVAESQGQTALEQAADLAALLSERDILPRLAGEARPVDLEHRLHLLTEWRQTRRHQQGRRLGVDSIACRQVDKSAQQYLQTLRQMANPKKPDQPTLSQQAKSRPLAQASSDNIGVLLAAAYPDRIAKQRANGQGRYQLSNGRGVCLPLGDPLSVEPYLVVPQLNAGKSEGRVFLAATMTLSALRESQARQIEHLDKVAWDPKTQLVTAQQEERLGKIVITTAPLTKPDPEEQLLAMLTGVRQMGLSALPWHDRPAREYQARVCALNQWQPTAGWPDLSEQGLWDQLENWLSPWLSGYSRKAHLKRLNMLKILQSQLDWAQQQRLEKLAPSHLQVPSGQRKRLQYHSDQAMTEGQLPSPVLAVRLQEMFGLQDTPTVCQGKVPVTLHLLSPAQRPIQVTQDLRGFWERTYLEVKKELKGRYPKHYWPDDPWHATATARVRSPK